MPSRYRRDDAVTAAPTERDFSLESPSWLFSYHLREIKVRTRPIGVISQMSLIPEYFYSFRVNESHLSPKVTEFPTYRVIL